LDRRKDWRAAERLLEQGNVQAALEQLRKASDGGFDDDAILNRLADLLSQQGKHSEAIHYYTEFARRLEQAGFAPKAIAIHKKILRLDPDRLDSSIRLGHLYGLQKLHGEARKHLLQAADRFLQARKPARAREVFEKLVQAEPDEPRHRVCLAEARVAEGAIAAAVEDLVAVGNELLERGDGAEAERIFHRAIELAPGADAPLLGAALCLERSGRGAESIALLEARVREGSAGGRLLGELAGRYEASGRREHALGVLQQATLAEIPPESWKRLFGAALARDAADSLWEQFDALLERRCSSLEGAALAALFEWLSDIEADGHIPALERLARVREEAGDVLPAVRALDALGRALRARSRGEDAARVNERLRAVAPPDEEPCVAVAPDAAEPQSFEPTSLASTGESAVPRAPAAIPLAAEAPAVPLNRGDEEFVGGRLTQAEVLEKYELLQQALEQIEEVVNRFPGHILAQERRVELSRALGNEAVLVRALTELALARRAAGDLRGAFQAAAEASVAPGLVAGSRQILEQCGLLDEPAVAADATPVVADRAPATGSARGPAVPRQGDVVIDLDAEGDEAPPTREGADFDLEAIRSVLEREFVEADAVPLEPEQPPSESVAEILGAFRKRVADEVATDDYRTHYELGVGFREMGLTDEAMQEFRLAADAPAMRREACAMLGLCHRDRGELDQAARWYRAALECDPTDGETLRGLRYDLAEILLEGGDARAALAEFRDVLQDDPTFRDVRGRVVDLENRLSP